MLSRAHQRHWAQTYIHKSQSPSGGVVSHSSKIASLFRDYYAKLYSLDAKMMHETWASRLSDIQEYLEIPGNFGIRSPYADMDYSLILNTQCQGQGEWAFLLQVPD